MRGTILFSAITIFVVIYFWVMHNSFIVLYLLYPRYFDHSIAQSCQIICLPLFCWQPCLRAVSTAALPPSKHCYSMPLDSKTKYNATANSCQPSANPCQPSANPCQPSANPNECIPLLQSNITIRACYSSLTAGIRDILTRLDLQKMFQITACQDVQDNLWRYNLIAF